MDVRLKEMPLHFDDKDFTLRCNMAVLAEIQEAYGGSFATFLRVSNTSKAILQIVAAMANDYADQMGWPANYTWRSIGRKMTVADINALAKPVTELVAAAIRAPESEQTNAEKNAETTPS